MGGSVASILRGISGFGLVKLDRASHAKGHEPIRGAERSDQNGRGLTQSIKPTDIRKSLNPNRIGEPQGFEEDFALHCSRPLASD